MERSEYTESNRRAWNEVQPIHRRHNFEALLRAVREPGFDRSDAVERRIFDRLGLAGKSVAQLGCNNGRELLSVKTRGAWRCVGFDISDAFIGEARELAAAGGFDCEFVRTDIYDIASGYDGSFDLVYVTIGVLTWMPDLPGFFAVVSRILRRPGWLFLYDSHPIQEIFEPDGPQGAPRLDRSYFDRRPLLGTGGLDYYGRIPYESSPTYDFHHTLAVVLRACQGAGFTLEEFEEYPHDISSLWRHLESQDAKIPLSYSLVAHCDQPR